MKSITIHNLDDTLDAQIRETAEIEGLSLNKTIQKLLCKALGFKSTEPDRNKSFSTFSGQWTEKDFTEFEKNIKELNVIDPADWE